MRKKNDDLMYRERERYYTFIWYENARSAYENIMSFNIKY
jgi:hypothetical protein